MNYFELLTETDKVKLVLNKGVSVATLTLRLYTIELYALDKVWIEVFTSNLSQEIFHIGIVSDEALNEYLRRISFSDLFI